MKPQNQQQTHLWPAMEEELEKAGFQEIAKQLGHEIEPQCKTNKMWKMRLSFDSKQTNMVH